MDNTYFNQERSGPWTLTKKTSQERPAQIQANGRANIFGPKDIVGALQSQGAK